MRGQSHWSVQQMCGMEVQGSYVSLLALKIAQRSPNFAYKFVMKQLPLLAFVDWASVIRLILIVTFS
jgi:hypothetical protein